jgi:hypothetical protein
MTLDEFKISLKQPAPPPGLRATLVALWHDARGDWNTAHRVAQDVDDEEGSWVHAYLHRKEGDVGNAAYWYRRAGRAVPSTAVELEWDEVATVLLTNS